MDKRIPIVALAAIVVVVLFIFLSPKGDQKSVYTTAGNATLTGETNCDALRALISSNIEAQKACVADSQCTGLSYGCPFGCGYYNKNSDMSEIDKLIQGYNSKCGACEYECYAPERAACINGKCDLAVCGDGICSSNESCPQDCHATEELIFQKDSGWGPCPPNATCSSYLELYSSGRLVIDGNETQLSPEKMEQIRQAVIDSGIMDKDCPHSVVLDYWAEYRIYIGGQTKIITFPGCETEMKTIEDLIHQDES